MNAQETTLEVISTVFRASTDFPTAAENVITRCGYPALQALACTRSQKGARAYLLRLWINLSR